MHQPGRLRRKLLPGDAFDPDPTGTDAACFTDAEFEIRWGTGVDPVTELLDLGLHRGLIDKAGNHLSFAGSPLGNGRERSREALDGSVELQSTLRQAILASGPVRPGRRIEAEA